MDRKTVLFADDQLDIVEDVINRLKGSYNVQTAICGNDAVERINRGGLDLIILDGSMPPGPGGASIAKQVREQYPNMPVILQSGEHKKYQDLERIGVKVMSKFDWVE